MTTFRIPKTIELFGLKVTTEFDDTLLDEKSFSGQSDFINKIIILQPATNKEAEYHITHESIAATYCHELIHFLFDVSGYEKDCFNEQKVIILGSLLYEAFKTAQYSDEVDMMTNIKNDDVVQYTNNNKKGKKK